MRSRLASFCFAAILAAMLALTSVSAAAAAQPMGTQPTGQWFTIFASQQLPAGTWSAGTYDYLWTLHQTWTLPAPGGDVYTPQMNGPYSVDPSAAIYPGNMLIKFGGLKAATSLGHGYKNPPTCTGVSSFNPKQVTRIAVALISDPAITRALWNHELATTRLTAILTKDAINQHGSVHVPPMLFLMPVVTELAGSSVDPYCVPALLR
jgi:hypothetical protein